jgi:hypothetical protein
MIAQYVGFTVTLTNRIRLIERPTRAYGRLKPEPIRFGRCRFNRQVRTHAIHELFGLDGFAELRVRFFFGTTKLVQGVDVRLG